MQEQTDNFKQQIIDLWKICFDDTDEFIHFYFEKKYQKENTLFIADGTNVVSALQMLPYKMTFYGTEITTSYISGACTRPSYRKQGLMSELLSNAFLEMRRRKISLTTLIPASEKLFEYYQEAGYVTVFDYSKRKYTLDSLQKETMKNTEFYIEEWKIDNDQNDIYLFFNEKMKERPCCIQHSLEDMKIILEDLYKENGSLLLIKERQNKKLYALIFVSIYSESLLIIKEFLYEGNNLKDKYLTLIFDYYNNQIKEVEQIEMPNQSSKNFHLGMARITDTKQLLSIYAELNQEKSFILRLTEDPNIPENEGIFSIQNGKCEKLEYKSEKKINLNMTVKEFTQIILGYKYDEFFTSHFFPYMSLMMN